MELPPAHAIACDAVIHFLGVLEAVCHGVVQAVIAVDTHERTPPRACDLFAYQHEIPRQKSCVKPGEHALNGNERRISPGAAGALQKLEIIQLFVSFVRGEVEL
jgi:hypothetical protein